MTTLGDRALTSRIIIVLLLLLCFSLWQDANRQENYTEQLCQNSIWQAYLAFFNFSHTGDEYYYISGVAEFNEYMGHYQNLNSKHQLFIGNEIYYILMNHDDLAKENIDQLVIALEYLRNDFDNANGENELINFRNKIDYYLSQP